MTFVVAAIAGSSGEMSAVSGHRRASDPEGVLPVDKPVGMTSHDVVDTIRRLYRTRRVGHTGTLDPAASGLLLIVLGGATRVASYLSAQDKTYTATVRFGATSDTGDADGTISPTPDAVPPDRADLENLLRRFMGEVTLAIPDYAAVRTQGRRRYELVRRGTPLSPAVRTVTIQENSLLRYDPPDALLRVRCSTGTYIRSLASALGEAVGCGAHLVALRREEIGRFRVSESLSLDVLERSDDDGEELPQPSPIERFLLLPGIEIASGSLGRIRHGQAIRATDITRVDGAFGSGDTVALRDDGGRVVALGQALFDSIQWPDHGHSEHDPLFRYQRVLI